MRAVVTGASSFLGQAVIRLLRERGHEVCALRHSIEEETVPEAFLKSKPERTGACAGDAFSGNRSFSMEDGGGDGQNSRERLVWFHFAWAGRGSAGRMDEEIQRKNIEMSMNALRYARSVGADRFLFAGSQAEYGGRSPYGIAKSAFGRQAAAWLSGETVPFQQAEICRRAEEENAALQDVDAEKKTKRSDGSGSTGMDYVHMRIFSVYGPGDHETALIPSLIRNRKAAAGMELGPCSQLWNYTYIGDLAAAAVLLAETGRPVPTVLDVAGNDTRPLREYVEEAWVTAEEFYRSGKPAKPDEHSRAAAEFPGAGLHFGRRADNAEGNADLVPDTQALYSLGFRPEITFREGIRRTAAAL